MSDNVDSATPNTGMMVESGGTYVNTVNSDHTTFAAPVASVTIISSPVSTVESSLTDYYRQLARATGIHTLSEITSKEHDGGTYASDIYVQPDVMIVEVEDVEDVEG